LWSRIKQIEGRAGANRFFQQVFDAMLLVGGVLAAGALWFAPALIGVLAPGFDGERHALATEYLRIVAPYLALTGIVAVLAAALNAQGRMVATGLGAVAFNVVLLLALAWIAGFGVTQPFAVGAILAYAILLAGIAQLIVTGAGFLHLRRSTGSAGTADTGSRQEAPPWFRGCLRFSPDTRRFFLLAVPGLVAAGVPQLKLIAGAMVASSSQAAVSWLYYANRLYELPLGVISIAMASVLVSAIAASVRSGSAIARDRDCDRPGASLRGRLRGAGGADRRRAVRARRLRAARYRSRRRGARGVLRRLARPRAREGIRCSVVRA
jgi:putative peptidoglycan lipid II flippase